MMAETLPSGKTKSLWRLLYLAVGAFVLTLAALVGPIATGVVHISVANFPVQGFVWYQVSVWRGKAIAYVDISGLSNRTDSSGAVDSGDDSCNLFPIIRAARAFGILSLIALLALAGVTLFCLLKKHHSTLLSRIMMSSAAAACIFEMIFFPLEVAMPSRIVSNNCFSSGSGESVDSFTNVGAVSVLPLIAWFVVIAALLEMVFADDVDAPANPALPTYATHVPAMVPAPGTSEAKSSLLQQHQPAQRDFTTL